MYGSTPPPLPGPPISYDLLTKSAVKIMPWIRQKYFNYTQSPKSGPKKWMKPQSAAIGGSGNPLKSRFESEILAKYFQNPPFRSPIHHPPNLYGNARALLSPLLNPFLFFCFRGYVFVSEIKVALSTTVIDYLQLSLACGTKCCRYFAQFS